MTGFQPHPGSSVNIKGDKTSSIDVEKIGQALGIPTRVVDPYDIREVRETLEQAIRDQGVSLVISRGPCFLRSPETVRNTHKCKMVHVNHDKCSWLLGLHKRLWLSFYERCRKENASRSS